MILPMPPRHRQTAAHRPDAGQLPLARGASARNAGGGLALLRGAGLVPMDHPPSQDWRPDRVPAGRAFPRRGPACAGRKSALAVKPACIPVAAGTRMRDSAFTQPEHPKRGSSPCASSSFFRSSSRRLPAACRIPCRAAPVALLRAPSSPMRPGAARLPARSSAVWLARQPVASTWACRPAARAIDLIRAAQPRRPALFKASQSSPLWLAFSHLAPAALRASEEDQCSRRS